MAGVIYVILGASGSGKTTSIDFLAKEMSVKIITKWSTRARRSNDGPEIISVEKIPDECDLRYTSYGTEYGFKTSDLWKTIEQGLSGAIVVNDIRTLKLLKRRFSHFIRTIYIHSNVSADELMTEEAKRYGDKFTADLQLATQKRIEKIKAVHRKYIENVSFFDSIILNVGTKDMLFKQIEMHRNMPQQRITAHTKAKCFVVCGNSYSGKDELAQAMASMQADRVQTYIKATDREKITGDGGNLNHYPDQKFPEKYDLIYVKQDHTYGISVQEIWNFLRDGRSPILVLNDVETIKKVSDIFGSLSVNVYLHANVTKSQARKFLLDAGLPNKKVEQRIAVAEELEQEFIDDPSVFNHVLLNTTELEDLYDQAFNLFDAHCV